MSQTQNDLAWNKLISDLEVLKKIDQDGHAFLSAEQLRRYREPRLMAKIDHSENLPEVFKANKIGILPISNKGYIVGNFQIFQKLPDLSTELPRILERPSTLETLPPDIATSESSVLHLAFASGMINDYLKAPVVPTVSGRMRTSEFDFTILTSKSESRMVNVKGAQIEIDGGYESSNLFALFEVKMHGSADFNLRQLYYPYRHWSEKISKDVAPIYMIYSNDHFHLLEYEFVLHDDYSSARLKDLRTYVFSDSVLLGSPTEIALKPPNTKLGRLAPFPQADSFEKVIDLVNILLQKPRTSDELSSLFAFDPRQSDYYFNAAKFLGLATTLTSINGELRIATDDAERVFSELPRDRNLELARRILSFEPFRQTYIALNQGDIKNLGDLAFDQLSRVAKEFGISGDTVKRRSSTVTSWVLWVYKLFVSERGAGNE
jgi:hypothetical protein